MSFGFGIGDFIAASNVAIKAYACLQDSTGSSANYQTLKLIRGSLGTTIAIVEAEFQSPKPSSMPKSFTNAAKKHLSECSQLLRNFDEITKKYDASLSPGGSGKKVKDTSRKLKWGGLKADTSELFRRLQGHIEAIEMLLAVHNAQALHRIEDMCVALQSMQRPQVPQSLDNWSDNKPIRFVDAFDRKMTLPYEWCVTWEAFHEAVRGGFRGGRESVWVESKSFAIFDEDNNAAMITPASWEDTISPGKTLSMSMRLKKQQDPVRGTEQECPSCRTAYRGYGKGNDLERVRCTICGTWFQVSSEPRITELSEDDSAQAPADATQNEATALMRIRRWHVVVEQTEQRYDLNL
ncbi:hypothetical protein BZA05DRAFT_399219 [Tricharina praecox]|uniref:uncharacterized protein n=1 Tax=Tricharina praecox TaxID=43433 RepID=UPI00221E561F|nr:uncharacterized protein BZA05DRAFT_399219 [Tricharina praecox]KAI5850933.1 hypothetical protein BZA05DRAFT_399219 [Tricharina praecox]